MGSDPIRVAAPSATAAASLARALANRFAVSVERRGDGWYAEVAIDGPFDRLVVEFLGAVERWLVEEDVASTTIHLDGRDLLLPRPGSPRREPVRSADVSPPAAQKGIDDAPGRRARSRRREERVPTDDARSGEPETSAADELWRAPVLSVRRRARSVEVALQGELDLHHAPELRSVLEREVLARPRRLTVDLTHVSFLDSSVLHVLLETRERLPRPEALVVVAPSPELRRIFEVTGADRVLALRPSSKAPRMRLVR